ncbi:MAG: hypothetical protein LBR74_06730 [Eubacterium sp.]|jgi:hypothetical protein|nr:hypothetical protein [Eubacterium sp.]
MRDDYKKHFLCYLDVLGYKELIERVEGDLSVFPSIINRLKNVIKSCIKQEIDRHNEDSPNNNMVVKFIIFSDSILLFVPVDNKEGQHSFYLAPYLPIQIKYTQEYMDSNMGRLWTLCWIIANIQLKSLELGIVYRGAISIGNHYYKDDVLFSKALVDAYVAESTIVKYPRIILLRNDILELAPLLCDYYDLLLEEDDDDFYFIDYLGIVRAKYPYDNIYKKYDNEIHNHKLQIEEGVESAADNKHILRKYAWMMNYHQKKLGSSYGYWSDKELSISKKYKKICFDKLGSKIVLSDFKYIRDK